MSFASLPATNITWPITAGGISTRSLELINPTSVSATSSACVSWIGGSGSYTGAPPTCAAAPSDIDFDTTERWSISAWIRISSSINPSWGYLPIIAKSEETSTGGNRQFSFGVLSQSSNPAGATLAGYVGQVGPTPTITSSVALNFDQWYHVVLRNNPDINGDGADVHDNWLFVDGVEVAEVIWDTSRSGVSIQDIF